MICRHCGQALAAGALFCQRCGKQAGVPAAGQAARAFCVKCGARLSQGSQFCTRCGMRVLPTVQDNSYIPPLALHTAPAAVAPHIIAKPAAPYTAARPAPPRKSHKSVWLTLIIGIPAIAVIAVAIVLLLAPKGGHAVLAPGGSPLKVAGAEVSLAAGASSRSVDVKLTEDKDVKDVPVSAQTGTYTLQVAAGGDAPVDMKLKLKDGAETENLYLCVGVRRQGDSGDAYMDYQYVDAVPEDGYLKATVIPSDYFAPSSAGDEAAAGKAVLPAALLMPLASGQSLPNVEVVISSGIAMKMKSSTGRFVLVIPIVTGSPYISREDGQSVLADFEDRFNYYTKLGFICSRRNVNDKTLWPFEVTIANIAKDSGGYSENDYARIVGRDPAKGHIELSKAEFGTGGYAQFHEDIKDTIAHELFHFIQSNYTVDRHSKTWFDEATAAFFGSVARGKTSLNVNTNLFEAFSGLYPQPAAEISEESYKVNARAGYGRAPLIDYLCAVYASSGASAQPADPYVFVVRCYEKINGGLNPESAVSELTSAINPLNTISAGYYRYLVSGCVYEPALNRQGDSVFKSDINIDQQTICHGLLKDDPVYKNIGGKLPVKALSQSDLELLKQGGSVEVGSVSFALNDTVMLQTLDFAASFTKDLPDGIGLSIKAFSAPAYAYLFCVPKAGSKDPIQTYEVAADGSILIPDIKTLRSNDVDVLLAISDLTKSKTPVNITVSLVPSAPTLDQLVGTYNGDQILKEVHVDQVVFDTLSQGVQNGDGTCQDQIAYVQKVQGQAGEKHTDTFEIAKTGDKTGKLYLSGAGNLDFTYENGVLTFFEEIRSTGGELEEEKSGKLTACFSNGKTVLITGDLTYVTGSFYTSQYYYVPYKSYYYIVSFHMDNGPIY